MDRIKKLVKTLNNVEQSLDELITVCGELIEGGEYDEARGISLTLFEDHGILELIKKVDDAEAIAKMVAEHCEKTKGMNREEKSNYYKRIATQDEWIERKRKRMEMNVTKEQPKRPDIEEWTKKECLSKKNK